MSVNYMDIACAVILILCVLKAARRGIAYFAVGIIANLFSVFLSITLNGKVTSFLRSTPLFDTLYQKIRPVFGFETFEALAGSAGLPSESRVMESVLANDNSEIYQLFGIDTFADYVSSYITNIALNIISLILIYVCSSLLIKLLFRANVEFSRLPGVKNINWLAGALVGLIEGVLIIWLLVLVLVFMALTGGLTPAYEALLASSFAVYFYKYNLFIYAILGITA